MERRVHTWWIVRERYRRVAWAGSALGAAAVLAALLLKVQEQGPSLLLSPGLIILAAGLLALGIVVPRLLIMALWRWHRARSYPDWH